MGLFLPFYNGPMNQGDRAWVRPTHPSLDPNYGQLTIHVRLSRVALVCSRNFPVGRISNANRVAFHM